MIQEVTTRTGKIFYDEEKRLEWLYVGDYGQAQNIKADFLGFNNEIYKVEHKEVDLEEKMVLTLSTQKGCNMKCGFCDAKVYGYHGDNTTEEMLFMINHAIEQSGIKHTKRLNVHFARMGEPTFNTDVLDVAGALTSLLDKEVKFHRGGLTTEFTASEVHPVLTTMLPKNNRHLRAYLFDWCMLKNVTFNGNAGLQFSIQSTDEEQRNRMFRGQSLSLKEISTLGDKLVKPIGRKYTLNFAVNRDTILNTVKLDQMFDKDKFIVKITPLHVTDNARANGYITDKGYDDNEYIYKCFEMPLTELGWDVIVFIPSEEEDTDRITCGHALLKE